MIEFPGFEPPKTNYSRVPHQLVGALPLIKSLAEMKVIFYVLRHTWGFEDKEKKITIDEFQHGRKKKDGTRIDDGTGMSSNAIKAGIKAAVKHGFLVVDTDDKDKARVKKTYSLRGSEVDPHSEVDKTGGQKLTPNDQELTLRGSEVDPRTEKETLERNSKKETLLGVAQNPTCPDSTSLTPEEPQAQNPDIPEAKQPDPIPPAESPADSEPPKDPKPKKPPTPAQLESRALFGALADVVNYDPDMITEKERGKLNQASGKMREKGITVQDLTDFKQWWYEHDWRGQKEQPPTLTDMRNGAWGTFKKFQRGEITYDNNQKGNQNGHNSRTNGQGRLGLGQQARQARVSTEPLIAENPATGEWFEFNRQTGRYDIPIEAPA